MFEFFATVTPEQDTPESAVRMVVTVFRYTASECDIVTEWDIPTRFTHAELLRSFDAHRTTVIGAAEYEYINDHEAHDNKEIPGLRLSFAVVPWNEV